MRFAKLFFLFLLLVSLGGIFSLADASQKSDERSFTFTAAGDFGANKHTDAVLDGISKSGSQFHLAVGDMSYDAIKPEKAWCDYVQTHLGENFPFEIISGNHEENGKNGLIDHFAEGFPDRLGAVGNYGKEYYFDYPKKEPLARFILISPDLNFISGKFTYNKGGEHYAWLSRTIDQARGAGIRWVIVGMHKNCISTGRKPCEIGEDVFNLLLEKKVDLILQGHDHNYQRSKMLALSDACAGIKAGSYNASCVSDVGAGGVYPKGRGSILVVAGTGGESIYPVSSSDPEAPYFAKILGGKYEQAYGFASFTVSSGEMTAKFVPCRKGKRSSKPGDSFRIEDGS